MASKRRSKVEARSDFASELVALAEQLRAREDLSDVELRLGRRGAKTDFTHAEKVGLALPDAMLTSYAAHDGLSFGWQERGTRTPGSDTRFVWGKLELLALQAGYLRPWAGPLGFTSPADDPELAWMTELVEVLRGLDVPELDQITRLVGFEQRAVRPGKQPVAPTRLWFFDCKGPKYPLTLDFDGYCREALALVAVAGWQAIFVDVEAIPPSQRRLLGVIVQKAEQALADVQRLFPGRARADHVERVARLRAGL
jgi:hypothetical protein